MPHAEQPVYIILISTRNLVPFYRWECQDTTQWECSGLGLELRHSDFKCWVSHFCALLLKGFIIFGRQNNGSPKDVPGGSVVRMHLPNAGDVSSNPVRRKRQPTPILLPGKSHGQRSLAGYSPWGREESDTTEWARTHAGTDTMYFTANNKPEPWDGKDFSDTFCRTDDIHLWGPVQNENVGCLLSTY